MLRISQLPTPPPQTYLCTYIYIHGYVSMMDMLTYHFWHFAPYGFSLPRIRGPRIRRHSAIIIATVLQLLYLGSAI
jgi:hypothetical protein